MVKMQCWQAPHLSSSAYQYYEAVECLTRCSSAICLSVTNILRNRSDRMFKVPVYTHAARSSSKASIYRPPLPIIVKHQWLSVITLSTLALSLVGTEEVSDAYRFWVRRI